MTNRYNPFKDNRTEQMKDLWKYYVPFSGLSGDAKPIVVEGGRGSGKTMFFQCNSWRQIVQRQEKEGLTLNDFFNTNEFVGIYYRVDTTFVSSMIGKKEDHWDAIFETYLSICILIEILDLLILISQNKQMDENELQEFSSKFAKRLNPDSTVDSLDCFRTECEAYLDEMEDKINGYKLEMHLRTINAHRFINDLCKNFCGLIHKELLFKIFIDEYETLAESHQKIINTLIKHSSLPVIFNIGLRPKGMKTNQTISDTETIETPHDYELIKLGFNEQSFSEIIKGICKKRIVSGKELGRIPKSASEDIEDYLGLYSIEYEVKQMEKSKGEPLHKKRLRELITNLGHEQNLSEDVITDYITILCDDAPILNSRVHLALLCKKTTYTPSLTTLYQACVEKTEKYNEWMHNRGPAAVFLLCKETKRSKMYFGFDAYIMLSSNNVRYFLELCDHALRIAFQGNYNWEGYISPETQTDAAVYVSKYKIDDIIRYEPYGKEIRVFVQYLGKIYFKLHTDDNSTLGEPEPNHFYTNDLSLSNDIRGILDKTIMWNVLQEGSATKKKQSKLSPETVDFYLNKIYCPYFGISYRNQRKIQIRPEILALLFCGQEDEAMKGFKMFFKEECNDPTNQDNQISFLE